jgi:hypothetical protein
MSRSSVPDPITPAEWIMEHATGPAAIAAERAPEHILPTLQAILDVAASAETGQDALDAINLAYHLVASVGGTPRQKRRSLRVIQGGP